MRPEWELSLSFHFHLKCIKEFKTWHFFFLYDFSCGMNFGAKWVWVFQKLPIFWEFYIQKSREFVQNGEKNKKQSVSDNSVGGNALMKRERAEKNSQIGLSCQEEYSNSSNHASSIWWAEKPLGIHGTTWLQWQKTTSDFTPVSQELESEAIMGTGSCKLDS